MAKKNNPNTPPKQKGRPPKAKTTEVAETISELIDLVVEQSPKPQEETLANLEKDPSVPDREGTIEVETPSPTVEDSPVAWQEAIVDVLTEEATQDTPEEENAPEANVEPVVDTIPPVAVVNPNEGYTCIKLHTGKPSYDLNALVQEIAYIATLDGKIDISKHQRMEKVPYFVNMLLPNDNLDAYNNREGIVEFDYTGEYYKYVVCVPDRRVFIRKVMEYAKKGAVLHPKDKVRKSPRWTAIMLSKDKIEVAAHVKVSPVKEVVAP